MFGSSLNDQLVDGLSAVAKGTPRILISPKSD